MTDTRPCTCAPDERPYPCQHQYALGLCRKAEIRSLRAQLDRCIAQIADMQKLRLEDELIHGNVMGRIAIALFGDQNNRTDEECVARAAEIGYQLTGTQQALFQAQEAAKMLTSEVAALRDQEEFNETALKGYRNNITALRHDIERHVQIAAEQAQEIEELRADLAAARQISGYDWNFVEAQAQSIRDLQSQLAAARADAARYRWIKKQSIKMATAKDDFSCYDADYTVSILFRKRPPSLNGYILEAPQGNELDAAIDAALDKQRTSE